MDSIKSLETFKTKSILDSTMKMELLKAWVFNLKDDLDNVGVEPSDIIDSLTGARDALEVARHFLLTDAVAGSVNDIVHYRLTSEVMDLINGVNLCIVATKKLVD